MISVIIATYNAQDSLEKTIASIINQSFTDFEIIIIDGGSNDKTVSIIKNNKDVISYWISEKDNGLYEAWNKGINKSKGEWICFLGAGDTLVPDAFMKYIELINQSKGDFDFISAKVKRVDENGHFLSNIGKAWRWGEFKFIMSVAHVGSLHNRHLFEEIGLFNENFKISADYELLLRKRSKLKCLFLDYVIGSMPIGGKSFSVDSLLETAKVKYHLGYQSLLFIAFTLVIQLITLKTYNFRHKRSYN
jgi:glycosyltransferase involved in cell wall biosynthesis